MIAFWVREHAAPAIEVRINFGVFAGRNATQAEIEKLARSLDDVVESFAVVAEERHEFGGSVEVSLRQIVIAIDEKHAGDDVDGLRERVMALGERWAAACIAARSDLGDLG
jgi:hypothetical protein